MFVKTHELFPIKNRYAFLSHCGISPLYAPALARMYEVAQEQCLTGSLVFRQYDAILAALHTAVAQLLHTDAANISFIRNATEGIGLIANGYPFEPGDEVVSYVHEYPANHYPWKLQERRGVKLVLLPDREPGPRPVAWSMHDLETLVTSRTRVVALSHVQFTSGYTADLAALSAFCRAHAIDLVLDAAQSLGCLPIDPETHGIAAVASSGWKWLMGPIGSGLLYTSRRLREKLELVQVGAETMQQGTDYLDHDWNPHDSGKRFEYSTSPIALAAALECCVRETAVRYGLGAIRDEIYRLQDHFLASLDRARHRPLFDPDEHRTPILSLVSKGNASQLAKELQKRDILSTQRGGYLRIAPHYCTTEDEVMRAAGALNPL